MFNLFSEVKIPDSTVVPMCNTGTLLDYITGAMVPGVDGQTYTDGGVAPTNGVHGPAGSFKSTVSDGMLINAQERFPGSQHLNYDTENCKRDKNRLVRMCSLYRDDPVKREAHLKDMAERTRLKNTSDYTYLEDFLEDMYKLCDAKRKHIKDFTVETPLYDPYTGKNKLMILPTFVSIDSLSKATLKGLDAVLLKHGDTSSEANMAAAREALMKNRVLRRIPSIAESLGIYFMFVGQNTKVMETGNSMPSKEMQHMRAGEKVKGVGSDFLYSLQSDIEVRQPRLCLDGNKECDYPYPSGLTNPAEMSEVNFTVVRSKNSSSGTRFQPVVSQSNGYEPALSNYNYLRNHKYFGLGRDPVRPRPALRPDTFFMRTTAYEKLLDYRTFRAVEIVAQLHMVQTHWTIMDKTVPFDITPEQLYEKMSKSGYMQDDILASRGWWTYNGTQFKDQPYMSLMDILRLACGEFKPKFWQVGKSKV